MLAMASLVNDFSNDTHAKHICDLSVWVLLSIDSISNEQSLPAINVQSIQKANRDKFQRTYYPHDCSHRTQDRRIRRSHQKPNLKIRNSG